LLGGIAIVPFHAGSSNLTVELEMLLEWFDAEYD
jgi:hypothetical protein